MKTNCQIPNALNVRKINSRLIRERLGTMLLTGCVLVASLAAPVCAADSGPVKHRFLGADYVGKKVAIIAANGTTEWKSPAVSPQDCWLLKNGNVLFCELGGVKEVTMNKEIAWRYDVPAGVQSHSCQPLPDG